jgi:hypothetical protein
VVCLYTAHWTRSRMKSSGFKSVFLNADGLFCLPFGCAFKLVLPVDQILRNKKPPALSCCASAQRCILSVSFPVDLPPVLWTPLADSAFPLGCIFKCDLLTKYQGIESLLLCASALVVCLYPAHWTSSGFTTSFMNTFSKTLLHEFL